MELLEIQDVEDCFDGSYIRNFIFAEEINEKMVVKLGEGKKLNLLRDFPKPFYQIIDKKFQIKGAIGNKYFQIIIYSKDKQFEDDLNNFLKLI